MNISTVFSIFEDAIKQYHILDIIEQSGANSYEKNSLEHLLYEKNWIDCVQWHCEDEVRNPNIEAENIRFYKQKIDSLNQKRTDLVEQLDDYFFEIFKSIQSHPNARLNTESPAWAIDRLSILALKIYHMQVEVARVDLSSEQLARYTAKLNLLLTQKIDLISSISQLLEEIKQGKTIYKLYRQVKMYNDDDLNPVLRHSK